MAATDIQRTIETVFRIERPRLIAGLARMLRDMGRAEELAQDALVIGSPNGRCAAFRTIPAPG